jgi:hypothetical protein
MRSLLIWSTLAALTACGSMLTSPDSDLSGLPAGLEAELSVAPDEVSQGASFDVVLRVRNTTADTLRITTASGCLVTPHVMLDGRRIPFAGSAFGCRAAVTGHKFAPGATQTYRWDMRAELYAQYTGDVDGLPAPKGLYFVVAEFETMDSERNKPFLGRILKVE